MVPSVCIQSLEQLYSSLMPLNILLLSFDWVPLIAALGPNDRSWSCLLKLKGLVFTLVVKLCLLYSYKVLCKLCLLYSYKVLCNLGFQPLSVQHRIWSSVSATMQWFHFEGRTFTKQVCTENILNKNAFQSKAYHPHKTWITKTFTIDRKFISFYLT